MCQWKWWTFSLQYANDGLFEDFPEKSITPMCQWVMNFLSFFLKSLSLTCVSPSICIEECDLGKLSKIKTIKHMEFSICWFTPPNIWKSFRDFLLAKNNFWLILRFFHFFPLKDQKYLENFHDLAQRMAGWMGGVS